MSNQEPTSPADIQLEGLNSGRGTDRDVSAIRRRQTKLDKGKARAQGPAEADEASEEEELDVKKLKANFEETNQIMSAVEEFEATYASSKGDFNQYDSTQMETETSVKVLKLCFASLKEQLFKDYPDFDNVGTETGITDLLTQLKNTMNSLCVLKGEFINVNEQVVNKDTFQMKLETVVKAKAKQEIILAKFEALDAQIKENENKANDAKESYEKFERQLFDDEIKRTDELTEKTNKFMEEIDEVLEVMFTDLETLKEVIAEIVPQTKTHIKQLQDMHNKVASMDKVARNADEEMVRHETAKDALVIKSDECREIANNLDYAKRLVEMVEQSKSISELVDNLQAWQKLYDALSKLNEDSIKVIKLDLEKALDDAKKLKDAVSGDRKEEQEDLIMQIRKQSAKNERSAGEQSQRLIDFDTKIHGPDFISSIPDHDMLYLQKEISRYNSSIETLQANRQANLDASEAIDKKKEEGPDFVFSLQDMNDLRTSLKQQEKMGNTDIPRIKKNIDGLEAYTVKALKNKLNEDNKKSQAQISQMKRNYEDLQKEIDKLNSKLGTVKESANQLKGKFKDVDADLEMDNEFKHRVEEPLNDCDRDINGDKAERAALPEDRGKDKPLSLQARKKEIIAQINKMVNQFNDNNKHIKDNSSKAKSEKDLNDLIAKNKGIQADCTAIDQKVTDGKVFAAQIDERLDKILDPTIPEIEAKYDEKNALVKKCDDLDAQLDEKMAELDEELKEELAKIENTCAKIGGASPIENPSNGPDKKSFVDTLSDFNDRANDLRDKLEGLQDRLQAAKDQREADIQPLCQMGEREVKTPEVQEVYDALKKIDEELDDIRADLGPMKKDNNDLEADVDKHLEDAKNALIEEAKRLLDNLNKDLDNLGPVKKSAQEKLAEYKDLIKDACAKDGRQDPVLMSKLKQLDREADTIGNQLKEIEAKEKDIKKKRDEAAKLIGAAFDDPDKFKPEQIEAVIDSLQDQQQKVDALNERADQIEEDLDQRIKDLKDLLANIREKKALDEQFKEASALANDNLGAIKDLLSKLPGQIDGMIDQCDEMKKDTTPDETADYWEEKEDIDKWKNTLKDDSKKLDKIKKNLDTTEPKLKQIINDYKKASDNVTCKRLLEDLNNLGLDDLLNQAADVNDSVTEVAKEIDDCQIPVNIKMRGNELVQLEEKYNLINDEFQDLKRADDAYDGSEETEAEIKELIAKISDLMKVVEQEKRDEARAQRKLEAYREKDIMSPDNVKIIAEIRDLRMEIVDTKAKLDEIDDLVKELNKALILQDMNNATKILEQKAKNLRERLQKAKDELKKIDKTGDDMDGNCSHNEEEEFIDALKEEMPEVFKNIDFNFDQLDKIDDLIKEVRSTKSIDTMHELKKEVDDSQAKVEQCEGLVNKLENEIIEWDALKKLCRRDEELAEIENLVQEFVQDLNQETDMMEKHLEIREKMLVEDPSNQETTHLLEGINNYLDDLAKLKKDVDYLAQDKETCFDEFNADVPSPVKEVRNMRNKNNSSSSKGKKFSPQPTDSDKPTDMYYMLEVNCKYRQRIHDMLKSLRNINQKRRELEEKYAQLKIDLNAVKKEKSRNKYVAVKGDAIDELWAFHLNKANLDLPVIRTGPGKYIFGTRNITAKITNGKLMVRVGGGYMTADEFINHYGQTEILKMMHNEEVREQQFNDKQNAGPQGAGSPRGDKKPRMSMIGNAIGIQQMKKIMADQAKHDYSNDPNDRLDTEQNNRGGSPKAGVGSPKAQKRNTITLGSSPDSFRNRTGSAGRNSIKR